MKFEYINHQYVRTVTSPVDRSKQYPEQNIIFANSLDFGVSDEKSSMITMRTVATQGKVQCMLNLDRKELDIQFPLQLDGQTRRFMFRLPFAPLTTICKSKDSSANQTSLIIPFDSPPQYFMQMREGEQLPSGKTHSSFSTREKTWNRWNTWFRETDVVNAQLKQSLRETPLMNHKDNVVVDIGESST